MAGLYERAEVGDAQRLGGDADGEGVLGEGSDGQADAVDGDGVALVAVCEEVGSGGDGDGHDRATGGGIILDARDGLALMLVDKCDCNYEIHAVLLPISSTIPVNMLSDVNGIETALSLSWREVKSWNPLEALLTR